MSFPDLMVKVRRNRSCRVTYRDDAWQEHTIEAEGPLAELLQHEIDHLSGILATMRAVDGSAFALRSERSE
jgi:peptide deformylase